MQDVVDRKQEVRLDTYGLQKPTWRGAVHAWAAGPMAVAGLVLVILAPTAAAKVATLVYAIAVTGMLTASAVYHRLSVSPRARVWLRRLDHSMIGMTVAGTYTPVIVLLLDGTLRTVLLSVLWTGAIGSLVVSFVWPEAPRLLRSALYVGLGWAGALVMPQLWTHGGVTAFAFVIIGAVLYTAGALVYARRKPDPSPLRFGFHEVFHTFVVSAAVSHFVAVAIVVGGVA